MWSRAVLVAALSSLAACAQAGSGQEVGRPDGGGFHHPDADESGRPDTSSGDIDAPLDHPDAPLAIDGPPQPNTVTLSQTNSSTLLDNNSIACPGTDGVGTSQNSYYRVFDLAAMGVTGDFNVTNVDFQVEDSESANADGSVVTVKVGTYGATPGETLTAGQIAVSNTANNVNVPELDEDSTTNGEPIDVPISATIPAGSKLVVEVDSADGTDEWQLYMGTNTDGETGNSYISTKSQCTTPGKTPTHLSTVGGGEIDLLLTVTGTTI